MFAEFQREILKVAEEYGQRFDVKIDQDFTVLKLCEEIGDYAQAVLIHRKKSKPAKLVSREASKKQLANELADIVGLAIINASLFGVDLEEALKEKWLRQLGP